MKKIKLLVLLLFFSCGSSDDNSVNIDTGSSPIVSVIDFSNGFAGDNITITATVDDEDNDITSYNWSVSGGSLSNINNTSAIWNSPNSSGIYTITLTVMDSENNTTTRSEDINLELAPTTFEKTINGNYSRLYTNTEMQIIDNYVYHYSSEITDGGPNTTFRLRKFDLNGNQIWVQTIWTNTNSRNVSRMYKTQDGSLILNAGDNGIYKINTNGDLIWSLSDSSLGNFVELENGNYFFTGIIGNGDFTDTYKIVSSNGSILNEGIIEQTNNIIGVIDAVQGSNSDTIAAIVRINDPDSVNDLAILELNSSGEIMNFNSLPYFFSFRPRLIKNIDGTYSFFSRVPGDSDAKIIHDIYSIDGQLVDHNEYGFDNYNDILDVIISNSGGYLICGQMGPGLTGGNAKSLIFKTDENGDVIWQTSYGNISNFMDLASSILELPNGEFMVSGSYFLPSTIELFCYLNKYNSDGTF